MKLGQHLGGEFLPDGVLAAGEVVVEPARGGRGVVAGLQVGLEAGTQDIEIAMIAEFTADAAQGFGEPPDCLRRGGRAEEVEGRFQSAGGDAGAMDGGAIPLLDGFVNVTGHRGDRVVEVNPQRMWSSVGHLSLLYAHNLAEATGKTTQPNGWSAEFRGILA